MAHDGIIHEETEREKNKGGVHRMSDKGIWAIYDEGPSEIRFGNDTEMVWTMCEHGGGSEEHTG